MRNIIRKKYFDLYHKIGLPEEECWTKIIFVETRLAIFFQFTIYIPGIQVLLKEITIQNGTMLSFKGLFLLPLYTLYPLLSLYQETRQLHNQVVVVAKGEKKEEWAKYISNVCMYKFFFFLLFLTFLLFFFSVVFPKTNTKK